jgi:hypothetical protein
VQTEVSEIIFSEEEMISDTETIHKKSRPKGLLVWLSRELNG